jgi:hypothetical protein
MDKNLPPKGAPGGTLAKCRAKMLCVFPICKVLTPAEPQGALALPPLARAKPRRIGSGARQRAIG